MKGNRETAERGMKGNRERETTVKSENKSKESKVNKHPFDLIKRVFFDSVTGGFIGKGKEISTMFESYLVEPEKRNQKLEELQGQFDSFVRMIRSVGKGQYKGFSLLPLGAVAVAIGYAFLRKDLISDDKPAGWWDDIAVGVWVLSKIGQEIEKFTSWEVSQNLSDVEIAVV